MARTRIKSKEKIRLLFMVRAPFVSKAVSSCARPAAADTPGGDSFYSTKSTGESQIEAAGPDGRHLHFVREP